MAALKGRSLERWFFCGAQLAAWASTIPVLLDAHPSAPATLGFMVSPVALVTSTLLYVGMAIAFAQRRAPVPVALALVGILGIYAHIETSLYPGAGGVHHGKLMPAAATLAWVIAWLASGSHDPDVREERGREAIAGVAAGCYVLAGLAKVHSGGLHWARDTNLPLLVYERAIGAWPPIAALREAFAVHAPEQVAVLFSLGAMAIEFGALALLFPRARRGYAIALIVMHLGIAVLLGYHYLDWILVLLALASAPRGQRETSAQTSTA